jgi:hypothetical protein
MQDPAEKYQAQVETLSEKELERVAKRLNNEELSVFIDALERHNRILQGELERRREEVGQAKTNRNILLGKVWCLVPDDCKHLLEQHFKTVSMM